MRFGYGPSRLGLANDSTSDVRNPSASGAVSPVWCGIRFVGASPLAPTKLTFCPDLEHGRQGVAESQLDRIGREFVLHPFEAHNVRAREQRRRQSLASIGSWRTTHEVTDALAPDPASPWFSRVAWANLCPIAPGDYKGNPEGTLRQVQTAAAAEFLGATVDALHPRLVLVLAGPFIWSFVEPLGLGSLSRTVAPFTLIGDRLDGVPWICGMHPGGAQRRGWPARRYAELIIAEAARLGVRERHWLAGRRPKPPRA